MSGTRSAGEKRERAERARQLLADGVLSSALDELRDEAINRLVQGNDDREGDIAMLRAVDGLRSKLQSYVTTGKLTA